MDHRLICSRVGVCLLQIWQTAVRISQLKPEQILRCDEENSKLFYSMLIVNCCKNHIFSSVGKVFKNEKCLNLSSFVVLFCALDTLG